MSRPSSLGEFRVLSLRETVPVGYEVSGPDRCVQYWKDHIETAPWFDPDKEHAVVLCLDTKVRAIGHNLVSIGTVDTALLHPREVFRPAILAAAHSIVVLHNHPSGDPSPSDADTRVSREILRAGQLLRIELKDSVVVGSRTGRHTSLKELGMLF